MIWRSCNLIWKLFFMQCFLMDACMKGCLLYSNPVSLAALVLHQGKRIEFRKKNYCVPAEKKSS